MIIRNNRGDTLVEVTIALGILMMTVTSVTLLMSRSNAISMTARERSQLVTMGQEQAEALTAFRDSNTWDVFLDGQGAYLGIGDVLSGGSSDDCDPDEPGRQRCFHMEKHNIAGTDGVVSEQWVPYAGAFNNGTGSALPVPRDSSIWISTSTTINSATEAVDFKISYSAPGRVNNVKVKAAMYLKLVNMDSFVQ